MSDLIVDLGDRSYPIMIQRSLLSDADNWGAHCGSQVCVVTNETIAPLYAKSLIESLEKEGRRVISCVLPDGELYKNLETLNRVFDVLLENNFNRDATLVALGGGVVGDMTGFAAASYQRGVRFVQIPTTLLSQVDSSVGGKTGVNHPLGKNMIGAFYQPQCVIIDLDVLSTLPKRELSAGLAEVIKYGLIYDEAFFVWLEQNMAALCAKDFDALRYAIRRSCEIKAEVVAQDEKESGLRAILNLGHTFGHAIESHQGYGSWLHGEAVGVGMLMACDLSQRLGWIDGAVCDRAKALCGAAGLPLASPVGMLPDDYLRYMMRDKKVIEGQLRLILLRELGHAVVTSDFGADLLVDTLSDFCREV